MKRTSIVTLCLCVFVAVVMVVAVCMQRVVPYWQCSEVYKKYSRVEGVRATYVKDFRVNDTLTVGVTLLEATDSAGWEYLLNAFGEPREVSEVVEESTKQVKVWARLAPKVYPEEKVGNGNQSGNDEAKEWNYDVLLKSYEERALCVFEVNSMEEYIALFDYSSDIMTEKSTNLISKRRRFTPNLSE